MDQEKSKRAATLRLIFIYVTLVLIVIGVRSVVNVRPKATGGNKTSFNFELVEGWNMISIPHDTKLRARKLCKDIPEVVEINRMVEQEWVKFDCENPSVPDFPLLAHRGYFIKVGEPTFWLSMGRKVAPQYEFTADIGNLWGISPSQTGLTDMLSVCGTSLHPEYKVNDLQWWVDGDWDSFHCALPVNNVALEEGQGYLIYAEKMVEE